MAQKNIFIALISSIVIVISILTLFILIRQDNSFPDPVPTPQKSQNTPLSAEEVDTERSSLEKFLMTSSGTESDSTLDLQITPETSNAEISTTSQTTRISTNDPQDPSTVILDSSDVRTSANPTDQISTTGIIFGIDVPNNLFIIIRDGEKNRISVTPKTTFLINKKILNFSSLRTGDVVTISGEKDTTGAEITAQTVTINSVFDF